ncbi:hypothetical protein FRB96_009651 [Tulasnella sp. 330]|nr:hypothetical protein FRB96_009651 [Tulasnella sp. 330]
MSSLDMAKYLSNNGVERVIGRPEAIGAALRQALRPDTNSKSASTALQGIHVDVAAVFWLRHCSVTAVYNRWDENHMNNLVEHISNGFLFEELVVDAAYLSRVMSALMAIMGWYPLWGTRRGHPTLNDSAYLKDAWSAQPGGRPIADQLLDILDAFSRHYETLDPLTIPTFVTCQKRLLMHINALYPLYHVVFQESPPADPPTSLVTRMHSSLNSNIERLFDIRNLADLPDGAVPALTDGEGELVRTLQRLQLTSGPLDRTNQDITARLAVRASTPKEKERLLQGLLYTLCLESEGNSNPLEASNDVHGELEKRREALREGHLVGLILTSALRLFLRLYPTITSDQTWSIFNKYLHLIAFGDLIADDPLAPASIPRVEVWDAAIQIAREDPPHDHQAVGPCTLWLVSRGAVASAELDGERVVEWFGKFVEQRSHMAGDPVGDGTIPVEAWSQWGITDAMCAGILFLEGWHADTASMLSQPSVWTSPGAIDAFATWLRTYKGLERVDIKLGDVVLMRISMDSGLVVRFIDHAILTNPLAAEECALISVSQGINDDRSTVNDEEIQQKVEDTVGRGIVKGCEWCTEGTQCMYCEVNL